MSVELLQPILVGLLVATAVSWALVPRGVLLLKIGVWAWVVRTKSYLGSQVHWRTLLVDLKNKIS